jgi:hypothetical protein
MSKRKRYTYAEYLQTFAPRKYRKWQYKLTENSFRRAWQEFIAGVTRPIGELWDELDTPAPSSPVGANGGDTEEAG